MQDVDEVICKSTVYYGDSDTKFARNMYVKTFLFDYILECQIERMKERYGNDALYVSGVLTDRFIFGSNDPDYVRNYGGNKGNPLAITSNREARFLATSLGTNAMEQVLRVHNCKSTYEYISKKFTKNREAKQYLYS